MSELAVIDMEAAIRKLTPAPANYDPGVVAAGTEMDASIQRYAQQERDLIKRQDKIATHRNDPEYQLVGVINDAVLQRPEPAQAMVDRICGPQRRTENIPGKVYTPNCGSISEYRAINAKVLDAIAGLQVLEARVAEVERYSAAPLDAQSRRLIRALMQRQNALEQQLTQFISAQENYATRLNALLEKHLLKIPPLKNKPQRKLAPGKSPAAKIEGEKNAERK
jgi:hypothetical protein